MIKSVTIANSLNYLIIMVTICLLVLAFNSRAEESGDNFLPDLVNISDIDDGDAYIHEGSDSSVDEFEGFNRVMFSFNDVIDKILFKPLSQIYETVVPSFARDRIRSVLSNLHEPVYFVNHILQRDPDKAANNLGRFITNSTIGLLGFMDIAALADIPASPTDFGLTLKRAGIGVGPYLVLPIIGPSSLRDAPAFAVDILMDPWGYYKFHHFDNSKRIRRTVTASRYSLEVIDKRQRASKALDQLERTSLDKYSTIRSIYLQKR